MTRRIPGGCARGAEHAGGAPAPNTPTSPAIVTSRAAAPLRPRGHRAATPPCFGIRTPVCAPSAASDHGTIPCSSARRVKCHWMPPLRDDIEHFDTSKPSWSGPLLSKHMISCGPILTCARRGSDRPDGHGRIHGGDGSRAVPRPMDSGERERRRMRFATNSPRVDGQPTGIPSHTQCRITGPRTPGELALPRAVQAGASSRRGQSPTCSGPAEAGRPSDASSADQWDTPAL